jgi:hypothetical protein
MVVFVLQPACEPDQQAAAMPHWTPAMVVFVLQPACEPDQQAAAMPHWTPVAPAATFFWIGSCDYYTIAF